MRRLFPALTSALLLAAPAHADDAAAPLGRTAASPPPARTSTLVVYGDDPCPKSHGDEIVVCARRPESERYRLPKRFRDSPPTVAQGSWTNRAAELDAADGAVLPNSCTPVGSNGQSGCYHKFLEQAAAERRQAKARAAAIP